LLETTIKVLFGPKNGLVVCPIGLTLWGKKLAGTTQKMGATINVLKT
jgi:hypothetical protein